MKSVKNKQQNATNQHIKTHDMTYSTETSTKFHFSFVSVSLTLQHWHNALSYDTPDATDDKCPWRNDVASYGYDK